MCECIYSCSAGFQRTVQGLANVKDRAIGCLVHLGHCLFKLKDLALQLRNLAFEHRVFLKLEPSPVHGIAVCSRLAPCGLPKQGQHNHTRRLAFAAVAAQSSGRNVQEFSQISIVAPDVVQQRMKVRKLRGSRCSEHAQSWSDQAMRSGLKRGAKQPLQRRLNARKSDLT